MSEQPPLKRFYVMKTILRKADGQLYHTLISDALEYGEAVIRSSNQNKAIKEHGIFYSVIERIGLS